MGVPWTAPRGEGYRGDTGVGHAIAYLIHSLKWCRRNFGQSGFAPGSSDRGGAGRVRWLARAGHNAGSGLFL
jgi:hypothetical protein